MNMHVAHGTAHRSKRDETSRSADAPECLELNRSSEKTSRCYWEEEVGDF